MGLLAGSGMAWAGGCLLLRAAAANPAPCCHAAFHPQITVLFGFCGECQRRSTLAVWEAVMQVRPCCLSTRVVAQPVQLAGVPAPAAAALLTFRLMASPGAASSLCRCLMRYHSRRC